MFRRMVVVVLGMIVAMGEAKAQDLSPEVAAMAKARNVFVFVCGKEPGFLFRKHRTCHTASGVNLGWDGKVLSAYHAFSFRTRKGESTESTDIIFVNYHPARLLRLDPENDLALLQSDHLPLKVPPVKIGVLTPGNPVILVASRIAGDEPEERLTNKVQYGYVLGFESVKLSSAKSSCKLVKTDALVLKGFSGGGYYDMAGDLVGVANRFEDYGNISAGISAEEIRKFLRDDLINLAVKHSEQ